jgi:hypothetical protein
MLATEVHEWEPNDSQMLSTLKTVWQPLCTPLGS